MESHQQLWKRIGFAIIIFAAILLAYSLYTSRIQRINATGTEFFTGMFIAISLATILFHSLLFAFFKYREAALSPRVAIVWTVVSFVAWFIASQFLNGFKVYAGLYLIWLLILNTALLIIANREKMPKPQNLLRLTAGIALSVFMSFLGLELLMRFYFSAFGSETDKIAYLYSVDEILAATNRYQGYPYINYGLSPNHPEHNQRGYRGEAFESPKPEGVFRIFTLGGSTTFGASLSPHEAYPAQLQRVLREDYGYGNVEVVNAGVSAYASADSLANLAYHVLDDEPDMIIIYDNVNDIRARFVDPTSYTGLNLQRGIWSPQTFAKNLSPSIVIRYIQIQFGLVKNPNNIETLIGTSSDVIRCTFQLNEMCTELDIPAQDILDANPPIYFERNLRNMVAIARANNVDVVFATWAYYRGETPLNNIMSQDYMSRAADEHNDIIRRLAIELDIPLIDFANSVPVNGEYWQDGMHMTTLGTAEQGEQFAAFLIEENLIPTAP